MNEVFVLVAAPVLGPASWQAAAVELARQAGRPVVVPSLTGFTAGGPPYAPRFVTACAGEVRRLGGGAGRVVLVVHSGAGPLAGQVAAAVAGAAGSGWASSDSASSDSADTVAVATIFADAGLPAGRGPTPVMDGRFRPYLEGLARGGMVPPWPEWFPDADPAQLYPNAAAAAAVRADARPLPLAFFQEQVPAAPPPERAGYLLFSAGYQDEARRARARGWPVAELPGTHLHQLADPAGVAAAIAGLAAGFSW